MKSTAETIVFAINSAIRLGRSAQQAYAKSLQSKAIVLPLPEFETEPSFERVEAFFQDPDEREGGHQFLDEIEQLADFHERWRDLATERPLTDVEKEKYRDYYKLLSKSLERDTSDKLYDNQVTAAEFSALLRIRQYESGEVRGTSPLQMVAGTIVTLGIDYFNQTPGALNQESVKGKVIGQFLRAVDGINFADKEAMRKQAPHIVPQLFISAAEAINELSDSMAGDPKIQEFIRSASQGIAEDLFDRMNTPGISAHGEEEAVKWGRLLLRSTIANAGHYVFAAPDKLFDLNGGATQLVNQTGLILLDTILKDPDRLDLKSAFSQHTMDQVLQSAFTTIAEHPELVSHKEGFHQIVTGVSGALANKSVTRPDFMPELLRLVLQHTAGNLQRLLPWGEGEIGPDGETQGPDRKFLLVLALEELLAALSAPATAPEDGATAPWRPRLSKSQLLLIANSVLDAVTENPAWVMPREGKSPLLREVIGATLTALERTGPAERFRTDLLILLIEVALRAVVRSQTLLDQVKWTTDAEEATVLEEILTVTFDHVFHSGKIPPAERQQRIQEALDYFVEVLLAKADGETAVVAMRMMLAANAIPRLGSLARTAIGVGGVPVTGAAVGAGAADILLETALDLLATYPELLTNNEVLATLISELATSLEASDFQRPDVLSFLAQAVLHHSARNAHLILPATDQESPRYLLLIALQQLLETISRPQDENWRLHLSIEEVQWLAESVLDHLVEHPTWILGPDQKPGVWGDVLASLRTGLARLPKGSRIQPETLRLVLLLGTEGAMRSNKLVAKIKWFDDATESVLLTQIFDTIVSRVIANERVERARLDQLLRFTFSAIVTKYPDERALLLLDLILFQSEVDLLGGWSEEQAQALVDAGVGILAQHPALLSDRELFQNLVGQLGKSLQTADLPLPDLLPEVLRVSLSVAAGNASRLLQAPADDPRSLLVLAVEQILSVVTQKAADGRWRPRFSQVELLDLLKLLVGEVNRNPAWVQDELIRTVLRAIYASFGEIQQDHPLPYATVRVLIESALGAVNQRKQLVVNLVTPDGATDGQLVLSYGLEGLFIKLYREQAGQPAGWTLTQTDVLHAVIPFFLARLAAGSPTQETVDQTLKLVQSSIDQLNDDLAWTVDTLIEELQTFPTT